MLNFEIQIMKDLFGKAILDYQTNNSWGFNYGNNYIRRMMSVAYLFRPIKKCRLWNKSIRTRQKVLLGCRLRSGSHSLYLQNELSLEVTAIDISSNAIQASSRNQRCPSTRCNDIRKWNIRHTILLLMNGGMCGD
jgi:intergrase/recombinase